MPDGTYQPKVYEKQGGDEIVVASGGKITVESGGAIQLPPNQGTGYIPFDLFSVRGIVSNDIPNTATQAGGFLAKNTTPILERINGATDKGIRVVWAATNVTPIQFAPVPYPLDLDDTLPATVKLLVSKDTNTDTLANIAVAYFEGVGGSNAGTNTPAITETTGPALKSVTIAASAVGPAPTFATVELVPGTHGTDAIRLYAAWLEYTRKTT